MRWECDDYTPGSAFDTHHLVYARVSPISTYAPSAEPTISSWPTPLPTAQPTPLPTGAERDGCAHSVFEGVGAEVGRRLGCGCRCECSRRQRRWG